MRWHTGNELADSIESNNHEEEIDWQFDWAILLAEWLEALSEEELFVVIIIVESRRPPPVGRGLTPSSTYIAGAMKDRFGIEISERTARRLRDAACEKLIDIIN